MATNAKPHWCCENQQQIQLELHPLISRDGINVPTLSDRGRCWEMLSYPVPKTLQPCLLVSDFVYIWPCPAMSASLTPHFLELAVRQICILATLQKHLSVSFPICCPPSMLPSLFLPAENESLKGVSEICLLQNILLYIVLLSSTSFSGQI